MLVGHRLRSATDKLFGSPFLWMRDFAPTKTIKTPLKMTLLKPSNAYKSPKLGHCVYCMILTIYQRIRKIEWFAFFSRIVLTELSLLKKPGHDGKFEHCVCVCVCVRAHHHPHWGARLTSWDPGRPGSNSRFFPWPNSYKFKVAAESNKNHDRFFEILTNTWTFWSSVQEK